MKNENSHNLGIRLRKRIAMGDKHPLDMGDFGCDGLDSHAAGNKPAKSEKHLADHERGAGAPRGGNQSNADHGPHGNHE